MIIQKVKLDGIKVITNQIIQKIYVKGINYRYGTIKVIKLENSPLLDCFCEKARMVNGLGQVEMTEVSWAFGHVARAGLTPGGAVNSTLIPSRIPCYGQCCSIGVGKMRLRIRPSCETKFNTYHCLIL